MKWILRIAVFLVSFAVVGSLAGYVTFRVLGRDLTVEVPDLVGRSLEEARMSLESKGLTLAVQGEEYDLGTPAGHVLSQDVAPGTAVRGEGEVKVVLSKGPEVRLIPSVIGKTLEEAKKRFLAQGIEIKKVITVHSDTVPRDKIIAQRPAPEEWTGEPITLLASAGARRATYYMPFFKGMSKEDATLLAAELGLEAKVEGGPFGTTISRQKPEPGVEVHRGDTVELEATGGFGSWR
jgi:beta-lactam-binding protein with PASTA domain